MHCADNKTDDVSMAQFIKILTSKRKKDPVVCHLFRNQLRNSGQRRFPYLKEAMMSILFSFLIRSEMRG